MKQIIQLAKGMIISQLNALSINRISKVDLEKAVRMYRDWETNEVLGEDLQNTLLKELTDYYVADLNYENDLVNLERGLSVIDPRLHQEWEPESEKSFYWRKQKEFLLNTLRKRDGSKKASRIINSISKETDSILRFMENPARGGFDSRGLVLGYVQSGKTANFTALISKAADAGYRFIIVLAGIHDELRQQTQIRIDRELTGINNLGLKGNFIEWNAFEEPRRWHNLTSAGWLEGKETGEFSGKGINRFKDVFLSKERPVIAIIKKNVKIMERLIKWVGDSDEDTRNSVPILVIDDEADQASIDGNANKEDTDPTRTNAKIRELLSLFKRKAYVGYTATPFANVFIHHSSEHEELGDDLYPRNFIHALPEPEGYFGTRKIFNSKLDHHFISPVYNSYEEKKDLADYGEITESIRDAIYTFILGMAVRNLRGQQDKPMSMMINIDHRVVKMNRVGEVIEEFVKKTLPNHFDKSVLYALCKEFLDSSLALNKALETENQNFKSADVIDECIRVVKEKSIEVRTLNSKKEDKLDYAKEPSMKVIAIGGNKLSRGLTLEGLMVTYYLRESKQFDTLLQMGRWFGYRNGYEDVIRIFTNEVLWRQFKDLATVELEFREDIQDMVNAEKTPKEFAVGVRQILGLLPTAKNKLGAAELENHYGGKQVSVTRLQLESPHIIDQNIKATRDLISRIRDNSNEFNPVSKGDLPSLLAMEVDFGHIKDFLRNFNIPTDTDGSWLGFNKDDLMKFIQKQLGLGMLKKWNVGIISKKEGNPGTGEIDICEGISVYPVNRARTNVAAQNGSYNIKAITGAADRRIDLPEGVRNEYDGRSAPLILIYFIDKDSVPQTKNENGYRVPLYQGLDQSLKRDPVSFSIIFPAEETKGSGVYIQQI